MKFLRDNIVKILIVVGVLIILIVILIACSSSNNVGNAGSYSRMEDNLKNAATRFLKNRSDLLPNEEGKVVQVQMDSIYTKKQMEKITAIDDPSVKCDGHVNVSYRLNEQNQKVYRLVPYIKCGDKYETEDFYSHILKNEDIVTELDGLYKIGDEYIYRGENPNNYVQIGDKLYRILSLDEDGYIKLINGERLGYSHSWDDRYNIDVKENQGVNDYYISRIRESLIDSYNNTDFLSDAEKNVFVKHKVCIGKRSSTNASITKDEECTTTIDEDYISLPLLYDYYIISTDKNCKSITDQSCNNYNYLQPLLTMYTPTGVKENTNMVFKIDLTAEMVKAERDINVNIVTFIANVSYDSGKGTKADPYIIK